MRPGRHAADDASFGRSAGTAAGRGAAIIAVALVIGIIFLNAADDPPATVVAGESTPTTEAPESTGDATTTTSAPATTVALRAPKDVKVLATNGTKTKGVAGKVTDTLRRLGYNVLAPTDVPASNESIVYVTAGYEREGAELARVLALSPSAVKPLVSPAPISDLRGANLLVIVGPDLAARFSSSTSPTTTGGSTTTTAARSTTAP